MDKVYLVLHWPTD